jgi:hypothetical protein
MATLAESGKPVKGKRQRTIRLTVEPSADNPSCVVTIKDERGRETDYHVRPIPSAFGSAFEVTKILAADDATYHVNLDGDRSSCDCLGFTHHGHCKHAAGLVALKRAGKL